MQKEFLCFFILISGEKLCILFLMTVDYIKKMLEEKLAYAPQLGAKIKLDFGDDGLLFIDGTQAPAIVNNDDVEADTTFVCSMDLLQAIVAGTQDPTMAFMTGKLKIKGSMGYALKLSSLFEE